MSAVCLSSPGSNPTLSALVRSTQQVLSIHKSTRTLVVFDRSVADFGTLVAGVSDAAGVLVLDSQQDAVAQITAVLTQCPQVDQVHIVSHGSAGCLRLGDRPLSLETLDRYAWKLQSWFPPASADPSSQPMLVLYGCCVAEGAAGAEFVQKLHHLTGATIVASTTDTGSALLGNKWGEGDGSPCVRVMNR